MDLGGLYIQWQVLLSEKGKTQRHRGLMHCDKNCQQSPEAGEVVIWKNKSFLRVSEETIPANNLIWDIWPPKLRETLYLCYFKVTTLMVISYSSPRKAIYSIVIVFMIYQCLSH